MFSLHRIVAERILGIQILLPHPRFTPVNTHHNDEQANLCGYSSEGMLDRL